MYFSYTIFLTNSISNKKNIAKHILCLAIPDFYYLHVLLERPHLIIFKSFFYYIIHFLIYHLIIVNFYIHCYNKMHPTKNNIITINAYASSFLYANLLSLVLPSPPL